jgi:hypothetical protein
MRSLVLLALATLAAFPLSAHDHWREPRRVVVLEAPRCAPYSRWEERRWDDRWERRAWHRRHDCEEDRIYVRPRPLERPFEGRMELRFR